MRFVSLPATSPVDNRGQPHDRLRFLKGLDSALCINHRNYCTERIQFVVSQFVSAHYLMPIFIFRQKFVLFSSLGLFFLTHQTFVRQCSMQIVRVFAVVPFLSYFSRFPLISRIFHINCIVSYLQKHVRFRVRRPLFLFCDAPACGCKLFWAK